LKETIEKKDPELANNLKKQYAFNHVSEGLKKLAPHKNAIQSGALSREDAMTVFASAFDPQVFGILAQDEQGLAVIKQIMEAYPLYEKIIANETDRYKARLQAQTARESNKLSVADDLLKLVLLAQDKYKSINEQILSNEALKDKIFNVDSGFFKQIDINEHKEYERILSKGDKSTSKERDRLKELQPKYDTMNKFAKEKVESLVAKNADLEAQATSVGGVTDVASEGAINILGIDPSKAKVLGSRGGGRSGSEVTWTNEPKEIPDGETPGTDTQETKKESGTLTQWKEEAGKVTNKMLTAPKKKEATKPTGKTGTTSEKEAFLSDVKGAGLY
jgi:hypothetical protein